MRKSLPFDVGPVHFVGIGGIGMSGIAEVMLNLGYQVSGSDIKENANTQRLAKRGAKIMIGHKAENIEGVGALVISSAIKGGNPEVDAARARAIPVVRRADMLAELIRLKWTVAIAGTHGKTTTTSMVAALLDGVGLDPTVINGGVINAYALERQAGRRASGWWWRPTRATAPSPSCGRRCASSPTSIPSTWTITARWSSCGKASTRSSRTCLSTASPCCARTIPKCRRWPVAHSGPAAHHLWLQSAGRSLGGQRALGSRRARPSTSCCARAARRTRRAGSGLKLPMAGRHNVQNSLAAIAVARELGGTEEQVRAALSKFGGVKRRFTPVGEWGKVKIIDDYGHHPVEIAAVLRAARDVQGRDKRVIAVVQPHRYTRLRDLFEQFSTCFNDADHVIVAPVYAAGEQPIAGISSRGAGEGPDRPRPPFGAHDRRPGESRRRRSGTRCRRATRWWCASARATSPPMRTASPRT